MTDRMRTVWVLSALVTWGACAGAQAAEKVALAAPYRDQMEGFVLRPPADTQRIREPSRSRLVTWIRRDKASGAIVWRFSVIRSRTNENVTDLRAHGKKLALQLKTDDNFLVESVRTETVAGKGAIHIRGRTAGAIRRWQRQVWVQTAPKEFLVFLMTGLPDQKHRLDLICQTVLATLEIRDPEADRAARRKSLERGRALLRGLNDKKLAAAVDPEARWFLMRIGDRDVGFMLVRSRGASRAGIKGFEVKTWALVRPAGEQARLMKRVLFTTANTTAQVGLALTPQVGPVREELPPQAGPVLEEWKESVQTGSGAKAVIFSERGTLGAAAKGLRIVCEVLQEGRIPIKRTRKPTKDPATRAKDVPPGIYLPRATAMLLPRLVDLSKPATYGFATYTTKVNDFDYRSFTVGEAETIQIAGKNVTATRITDQVAADASPTTVWVDSAGKILRMENRTPGGAFAMQATGRAEVVRRFPDAEAIVRSLGP